MSLDMLGNRAGVLDEFHHEERHRATRVCVDAERVDLGDVRVPQPCQHLRLVLESPHERCRRQAAPNHLDGDAAGGRFLSRLVHAAHATLGEEPDNDHSAKVQPRRKFSACPVGVGSAPTEAEVLIVSAQARGLALDCWRGVCGSGFTVGSGGDHPCFILPGASIRTHLPRVERRDGT